MKTVALRDKDLAILRGIFRRFPWVSEVRVFGSRATGQAHRASDLDLAIFAPEASATEWAELVEALDQAPLIYEFDLVRPERAENPQLIAKIIRDGLSIYPERLPPGVRGA